MTVSFDLRTRITHNIIYFKGACPVRYFKKERTTKEQLSNRVNDIALLS